ncbi:ribosome biogenesis protein Nop16 [Mycena amicta]|nr:ribosome biogenesis protein Nop16 [Mycena amicta]
MANPRQRRKKRSSTHRAVSHSRNSKKMPRPSPFLTVPIRAPTVPLAIRGPASAILNARWDKRKTLRQNYAALGLAHTLNPSAAGGVEPTETSTGMNDGPTPSIPKGRGRILRDDDGNVVGIELAEDDDDDEENEAENQTLAEQKWLVAGAIPAAGPRHPSRLELTYIQHLVDKHGTDVLHMARDTKLNAEQRTVGELKRALRRCGFAVNDVLGP